MAPEERFSLGNERFFNRSVQWHAEEFLRQVLCRGVCGYAEVMKFAFSIDRRDGGTGGRLGRVTTPHGSIVTPAFMAVGTRGSIKGVTPEQARECGCEMILGNTYHLLLRPGAQIVADLGGLQKFSGWDGPMLTDSGGFQVFSLANLREFDSVDPPPLPQDAAGPRDVQAVAEGVIFRSHIDGEVIRLTPEESMRVQHLLGADVIMAFDDCPPANCPAERLKEALERTHKWAEICKSTHDKMTREGLGPNGGQALFGIVQGGTDGEARAASAAFLRGLDLPGYALGGLAVGEGHERMVETIRGAAPLLPDEKPRYLMGVGYARDILEAVKAGVDMFDCVLPTRNGRNGLAFTMEGTRRIRNLKYARDGGPIEEGCDCYACRRFSRGYIRHLFHVKEMLGPTLLSIHNLRFFQRWMGIIREAIGAGRLAELKAPGHELARDDAAETAAGQGRGGVPTMGPD
jgi:queuine tRNA-ribosyltransferase